MVRSERFGTSASLSGKGVDVGDVGDVGISPYPMACAEKRGGRGVKSRSESQQKALW